MALSVADLPPYSLTSWGKRQSNSSATLLQYFTLPQHHSKVEGGNLVYISKEKPLSPGNGC